MSNFLWPLTPDIPDGNKWNLVLNYRNQLLLESDWTQLVDVPLTAAEKELWQAYRQTLRDINVIYTNPDNIIWPTPPGGTNG